MKQHVILFLAANPDTANPLRLGEECAAIQRELTMVPHRDDFRFESPFAVSIDELIRHLNELSPTVIHFSGHGGGKSGLLFQDEQRRPQPVSARALAMIVDAAAQGARLVVLNACYTTEQAEVLRARVECVVGIAARACADPARADAEHQRLLHFALDAPWSDHAVRLEAARYALDAMTVREPVESWIIDDTGFLKQGNHSVGVQRQYSGSAGKIANCQVAVSLTVATQTEQLPIDFALYLPESWTEDRARRCEARIPNEIQFATKTELALQVLRRALDDKVPPGLVLADQAYGTAREFRNGVREMGLHYAVAVDNRTTVMVFDKLGRRREEIISIIDLAHRIDANDGFRRCTWRQGTKQELSARFALRRVVPAYDGGHGIEKREPVWLLIEWRDGEDEPANCFLCSRPERMTKKRLVRMVMQRWRTERAYQDLKDELGLDHYEGRRFPGWHHHVSVVLCCYAFVIAERVRHFPPSAGGALGNDAQSFAA